MDGPSIEADISQHYQSAHPGQVQVIGVDILNGSVEAMRTFRSLAGVTFPLLLRAQDANSGTGNMATLYSGDRHQFVVVNKQGIVRLNTYPMWAYPTAYRLNEIRACIDSLVSAPADVGPSAAALRLAIAPNPSSGETRLELAIPGSREVPATVTVHDLAGRRVAALWSGPSLPGLIRLEWDGRTTGGAILPAGVYMVWAAVGRETLTQRIVRLH